MIGMVIVNYNDYETTKRLLDNVKDYKVLKEIVVVDNKSTDNSLEELRKLKNKKITIIDSGENKGYSYALNVGCKYLIDKYKSLNIVISNSDIIIESELDIKDLNSYISTKNVIVGPTIIQGNDLNRGFKIPSPWQDIKQNIVFFGKRVLAKELSYPDNYYHKDISKVDTVSGCFFMISSKHLEDMGYFDENVFLYYEENIMGIKTKKLGKNIIVCNNVDVIHDHSVSIDKSLKRIKKYDILKTSQEYFEKKYNGANKIELFFLKVFRYLTRILLLIKYLVD
ncbi:MAG: glycosyltransferase family 2 protein [Bacilli bacterium]|nr:glycosyltransferase family 2 protein [Bacilli bacterium]